MLKKIIIGLLTTAVVLFLIALGFLYFSGAWSAFFPSSEHDTSPPEISEELQRPAVLLFTKTNGFRHVDGIEAGSKLFKQIAKSRDWGLYHTENGAVFNTTQLQNFDAVVFHNATGDMLSDEQELAFQQWMETGGGWFGVHAAGDGSHKTWDWYMDNLLGAKFTAHIMGPQFQVAKVNIEAKDHPAVHALPSQFEHSEEWYSWEETPRKKDLKILATIDENSYNPVKKIFGQEND
ncbi:MAG: ThuA domain-containing protein, partial [Pseudomonadales bacterium]